MKVWFYHNSPWPFRRSEISFPFSGAKFDPAKEGSVVVTTAGAKGNVSIDAVQVLPK